MKIKLIYLLIHNWILDVDVATAVVVVVVAERDDSQYVPVNPRLKNRIN